MPASSDTVLHYTVSGSAMPRVDYSALSRTVTISAGDTEADIDVTGINDDSIAESDETVTVTIDSITSADSEITISPTNNTSTVTIDDNDYIITPSWSHGGNVSLDSGGSALAISNGSPVTIVNLTPSTFTLTADHEIDTVLIDGMDPLTLGYITPAIIDAQHHSYTFESNTDEDNDHTINVTFKHRISMTAGNGTITDTDTGDSVHSSTIHVTADHASDHTLNIDADAGYCVRELNVNGTSLGPFASYNNNWDDDNYIINNIQDDTTVEAVFSLKPAITVSIVADDTSKNDEIRLDAQWRAFKANADFEIVDTTPIATGTHGETFSPDCDAQFIKIQFSGVDGWATPDPVQIEIQSENYPSKTVSGCYVSLYFQLAVNITGDGEVLRDPPGIEGSGADTYVYETGDEVTLTADAASGSVFHAWKLNGSVVDTDPATELTLTMDHDAVVEAVFSMPCQDADKDGYTTESDGSCVASSTLDCDDTDSAIHPDASEICGDGIDQDCNGSDQECTADDLDGDNDGFTFNQGDCDPDDPNIHPGAFDICENGIDEDCYDGDRQCATEVTCVDLSDDPLNVVSKPAPPLLMFLLDDSGSMDWEFMTDDSNGLYQGRYYIFEVDYRARNYSDNRLDSNQRHVWKTQWAGYNRIYYDPEVEYKPWPRWHELVVFDANGDGDYTDSGEYDESDTDSEATPDSNGYVHADLDHPRLNSCDRNSGLIAMDKDYRGDLDKVFMEIAVSTSTPGTRTGQQITVTRDNPNGSSTVADAVGLSTRNDLERSDARTYNEYNNGAYSVPEYPEIIFDNKGSSFSSSSGWTESGGDDYEWENSAYYATVNGKIAVWKLDLTAAQEDDYYVYVWTDKYCGRDTNALYTLSYYEGDTLKTEQFRVNQRCQRKGGDGLQVV